MQAKTKPQSRLGDRENISMPSFDLTVVYRRIDALKPERLIPLSQVGQYLGLAGQIQNGAGFEFFGS